MHRIQKSPARDSRTQGRPPKRDFVSHWPTETARLYQASLLQQSGIDEIAQEAAVRRVRARYHPLIVLIQSEPRNRHIENLACKRVWLWCVPTTARFVARAPHRRSHLSSSTRTCFSEAYKELAAGSKKRRISETLKVVTQSRFSETNECALPNRECRPLYGYMARRRASSTPPTSGFPTYYLVSENGRSRLGGSMPHSRAKQEPILDRSRSIRPRSRRGAATLGT